MLHSAPINWEIKIMKTLYGYIILYKLFWAYLPQTSGNNIVPVSQRYFNSNTNIDSKIRKRIAN